MSPTAPPQKQSPADALQRLAEDVWQTGLDESPITATFMGDRRGSAKIDERGPKARARRTGQVAGFLKRLAALPPLPLTSEDGLTQRVLQRHLEDQAEDLRHPLWEQDVDQIFGLHVALPNVLALQPLENAKDLDDMVARLEAAPDAFQQWQGDLKDGLASGRTPPTEAVERTITQLKALAEGPAERSPFAIGVSRLPAGWSAADKARATSRIHGAVERAVKPAIAALLRFLETEVRGRARKTPGLVAIPGGKEAYAFRVRQQTTTDLTPEQIHAIGNEELEANRSEMLAIARDLGHKGDLPSFLAALAKDPRFRLKTREDILARYRSICARMDARLEEWFGRLPKTGYVIQPIEEYREKDSPAAFYQPPPEDRSRGGIYYANTRDPGSWATYDFEALCYHEAVPGHHLQIAIAQELPGLPALRRHAGFNAYIEGWAHYTERLADEVGMYSTPHDRIGMLAGQAWRAARLVVDTGLHAFGWPRTKAVALLESIRAGSPGDVANEVDRYIIWPGQALSYKVGSRTITRLREKARARLGTRFTLSGFHDEVLGHGALPLSLLEQVLDAWPGGAVSTR